MIFKPSIVTKIPITFILCLAIISSFYFYRQYSLLKNSKSSENEIENLMASLSECVELPDEIPTLATVTDKSKLIDQAFFKKSENGDQILIFSESSRAILYRPSTEKIINVSDLVVSIPSITSDLKPSILEDKQIQPSPSPSSSRKVEIVIYNGTQEKGLAAETADTLNTIENLEVIGKVDAVGDYSETVVVDMSGKYPGIAKDIASLVEGKVGDLPDVEEFLAADILIILGRSSLEKANEE